MNHTVEDSLILLGGVVPKLTNINLDQADKTLIKSLVKQVIAGTGLTDRQLDVSIKKIEKYRVGLEHNGVNIDRILLEKNTRLPLREIDRTQTISLVKNHNQYTIVVKTFFSKRFQLVWNDISPALIAPQCIEKLNEKIINFNEKDLHNVVSALLPLGFVLSEDIAELYNTLSTVVASPTQFIPYIELVDNIPALRNVSQHCLNYVYSQFPDYKDEDFLVFIAMLKTCGIYHKSSEIISKINESTAINLTKNVLLNSNTRFRINPEEHSIDTLFDVINTLRQSPLLFIVDDDATINTIKPIVDKLLTTVTASEINIFFRLAAGTAAGTEFNQYVKDTGLNTFIGPATKVVFVSKGKIPKPLLTADWHPQAAVVLTPFEYGKTSAFLKDFQTVYYYNNGLNNKFDRKKGQYQIVQM